MNRKIMWGLILGAVAVVGCGTTQQISKGPVFSEEDGIFYYKTGQIEVYMLVESQREGNADILVGVDEAFLARYIPESGFSHSTNVFFVKAKGQNILIDTGFGTTIFEKMQKLGVEPDQIDAVLITHLHGDHIGGLQKDGSALFPKANVYVSSGDLDHFADNAGAKAALAPYGANVVRFEPAELGSALKEIIPGFSPIANYGHTPGHTVYLIKDGNAQFLITGDFLHVALVQFPNPGISASYDIDKEAAARSRTAIMDYAAKNKIPIGGMHMVYPGVGTVEVDGTGFTFTPAR